MIRALIIIAVAGFFVSVATLGAAVAITGPQAIARGAWAWSPHGWGRDWDDPGEGGAAHDTTRATREIAWDGGALRVDLPADVRFSQVQGPGKVVVSGPVEAVTDVEIEDGALRYAADHAHDDRLTVEVSVPAPAQAARR
jgi:hypothetical protein